MALSRRSFLRLGGGVATLPLIGGRGLEAAWGGPPLVRRGPEPLIRIDSNENPNGPSDSALRAVRDAFEESNRYPDEFETDLAAAIARVHGVLPDQVAIGCGSTEHLRLAVEAFASRGRPVVTAAPSFEATPRHAERRGIPVVAVPVGADLGLDLDQMLAKAAGAGLVYVCNPNNPTGTVHPKSDVEEFIRRVLERAPAAMVLIDEAYFEYVDHPGYGTLIPMALADPRVIVLRTLSKVHGMAGLRVGYAIGRAETVAGIAAFRLASSVNVLGAAAAIASLGDRKHLEKEARRNREARAFTRGWFERAGYQVADSHTNFVMVAIRRPSVDFRKACADRGVAVGRPFPPLTTHARISIGTMDEMKRAVDVFADVLAATATGS